MSNITFKTGTLHLQESRVSGKEYLDLEAYASGEYVGSFSGYMQKQVLELISAVPDMHAILTELEGTFDREIEPEQQKEDYDAPDDREYSVTITAKQWRALSRALGKAGSSLVSNSR